LSGIGGSAVLEAGVPFADAAEGLFILDLELRFFLNEQMWALVVVLVANVVALAVGLELLA